MKKCFTHDLKDQILVFLFYFLHHQDRDVDTDAGITQKI